MRVLREENEALRREVHDCREMMDELMAEIDILRELKGTNARKSEFIPPKSDGAFSPLTPVAMEEWVNVVVEEVNDSA
ncbi:hypothetical protein HIM_10969 [Hirsutella minnesotensis 3608]|uniref:Uncharacterized protein n=1 Tax=Hirsutella minnesotensis 3608 TaxID=1043627 RepID=A0A0F7ZJG3_9HYPO|nr:hypothetical protein HIM_10969 [Hirsutella minnesotensis 3608]